MPNFVSPDELAKIIRSFFTTSAGLPNRMFQTLRHEIQIPFTSIEVETECKSQKDFIEENKRSLAELVFKPASWEVERASQSHANFIMREERVWSIAQDAFAVVAYEGVLFVKIKTFDTGVSHEVSEFYLADEPAILHSFKVAVSNYHFLRILDDRLDQEAPELIRRVQDYEEKIRLAFEQSDSDDGDQSIRMLTDMNIFSMKVVNLQFQLTDLLEEIHNSDKLIDEEWHIQLLDKLNNALGTKMWLDTVKGRIDNIRDIVNTLENIHQRITDLSTNKSTAEMNKKMVEMTLESQQVENRLKRAQPVFLTLAAVEGARLLIDLFFDSPSGLVKFLEGILPLGQFWIYLIALSMGLGTIIFVVALIIVGARLIARWEGSEDLLGF